MNGYNGRTESLDVNQNSYIIDEKLANEIETKNIFKDIKPEDLIRGTTPENIEQQCVDLCKAYIGGTWSVATVDDVEVKRISGGLTNQLYYVGLKHTVPSVHNPIFTEEPREVSIKLYQKKHFNNAMNGFERLNDTIVSTIVSELNIGPKIYGIFENGVVQAYYKHEQFRPKHQQNDKLLRQLAHILAKIHSLNVPIEKKDDWMIKEMEQSVDNGYKRYNVKECTEKYDLDGFKRRDLKEEFHEMVLLAKNVPSPIVFCHSDFRGSNIMVTGDDPDNQKIVMCDYEYSAYGGRGSDLATFMTEWGKELFDFNTITIPPDEVLRKFITYYVECMEMIKPGFSQKAENSVEHIMNETKVHILFNLMFFVAFILNQTEPIFESLPFDEKSQFTMANMLYKAYFLAKQQLINEGIFPVSN